MHSIQEILQAATTLSSIQGADKRGLLTYRKELETAFYNLQSLLQPNSSGLLLDTPAPSDKLPAPDTSASSAIHTQESKVSDSVKLIMERLEKNKTKILKYSYQPVETAVLEDTDDPRVISFKQSTNKKDSKMWFRAGLSALSLAGEYTEWEKSLEYPSRLDALGDNNPFNTQNACFKEYVDSCEHLVDKKQAKNTIECGIKFLYFQRLYSVRSNGPSLVLDTHLDSHLGVLGLLFFVAREFRRLKYSVLPMLANTLLLSDYWRKLADEKNNWMEFCLRDFERSLHQIRQRKRQVSEYQNFGYESEANPHDPKRRRFDTPSTEGGAQSASPPATDNSNPSAMDTPLTDASLVPLGTSFNCEEPVSQEALLECSHNAGLCQSENPGFLEQIATEPLNSPAFSMELYEASQMLHQIATLETGSFLGQQ
ncbi:uncharacterized protein ATNIH1004_001858 [Aspergillus tanneri]|uniref:Uncharacterized protein n=1 Tax=Aspergillus tanneri TaxID=1220188 RepID=A0A5M9M8Z7_9EURO|nr:uncharacterized protein ATNIH1004_001858 [Aspergillus tanneri]KAA8641393.1 hypothetical protein ATNIH1004_001858 [Aspergillus tanneri]